MWSILALWLSAGLFVSADGACQAQFPATVPDRPAGFIVLESDAVYAFNLKIWKGTPESYYQDSKLLHSIEAGVQSRALPGGGLEYRWQPGPERHRVLREYALNGFVYEFSVNYSGDQPAAVRDFLDSIRVRPTSGGPSRVGLIQCSLVLDGLASQLLDHRPWEPDTRCPVGGRYRLERHGLDFEIYCDGDHGLAPGYPRIDQNRQVWEGLDKPLPRPDL
ncbi:hypothetical protein JST97_38485 [bacterium]|nr:hypothetical protein [bacterium]